MEIKDVTNKTKELGSDIRKMPGKMLNFEQMMRHRTQRNALFAGFGVTLLVLLLQAIDLGSGMSLRSLDFMFWLRGEIEPKNNICIVAIDNESFNEMPERWVWPRSFHAKLIRQIMRGKPKAIVFDVLFTEETAADSKQDSELAAAARSSGCVILGAELTSVVDKRFRYSEMKLPIKPLRSAIYSAGVVNTPMDGDAFVRRANLIWKVHEERYFSLPLEGLRKAMGVGKGEINYEPGRLEFGDKIIPLDANDKMLINYRGPAKTFKTIPYYQVFKGIVSPEVFRDAIVFVGSTAEVLHDNFYTPFSWKPFADEEISQPVPGVEIHANTVETIMNGDYIKEFGWPFRWLMIFLLGGLVSVITIQARVWVSIVATGAVLMGLVVMAVYLFIGRNEFLDFMPTFTAVALSFVVVTSYRAAVEKRERQRMKGTFSRYLSPHVLNEVMSRPPEMGGSARIATILFSDIRGFTSMSEKMTAHEVVERLNEYLTAMVDQVLKHDGTLDKFVGDAIMAVYNSPMDQPDHAIRGVSTAWYMSKKMDELQAEWVAAGKVSFNIGIGLNTGEVVAGNMGSPQRMEFTVIGDNVNLASRMESQTKEAKCRILISESTYEAAKDFIEVKERGSITVKGKEIPVKAYEVTGLKPNAPDYIGMAAAKEAKDKKKGRQD
jgi:adenylate cyclase